MDRRSRGPHCRGGGGAVVGTRGAIPAVSANILARRLRELEEAGIISWRALTAPAGCRGYELTTLVEAAHPVIGTIDRWASVLVRLG
ncbi:winged helix-turn-helix transcriptional regulator [Novosphingobium aerophilum]|uniref:winged helix-turn-helix transcriptional regulator n=1 Tax=Novosphingobium TaxID=165696 RepID=UPI003B63DB16